MLKEIAISKLVFDFGLYPRTHIDSVNVTNMLAAMQAGNEFPPIVVDKKSLRIVDGFHRVKCMERFGDENASIRAELKNYANEGAIFQDAMLLNSSHGRAFSNFERAKCIFRAEELKIDTATIAICLRMTPERLDALRIKRGASLKGDDMPLFPVKNTIQYMAGRKLTADQYKANDKLGGMKPLFYVNQLLILLENNLIDKENPGLIQGLEKLSETLEKFLKKVAA